MDNEIIKEQVAPKPATGDCWLLVLKDMEDRRKHGIEKYGVPMQPFNGRDPLIDAYQEMLDYLVYTRQYIEEMKCLKQELENLYVLLVETQSHEGDGIVKAASLLESILLRKFAVTVGKGLLQHQEFK